jgi:xanthine dehydrogenase accessory factor
MIQVWPTVERFLTEHGAAVPVTLAKVQGSSPREPRARFMVRPDGRLSATFDGVALECLALAEAQSMTAGPGAPYRRLDKARGPEFGQRCGGRVLVTRERLGAAASASIATVLRRFSAAGASHA